MNLVLPNVSVHVSAVVPLSMAPKPAPPWMLSLHERPSPAKLRLDSYTVRRFADS